MPWITTGASAASRACRCCRLRRTKRPKWSSCWRTSGTEQKRLPLSLVRVGTGKHLGFVLLAWVLFFMLAAWVLPPLDSHLKPEPLVHWSFITLAALLAFSAAVIVPAYLYQSWRRLTTVPNRTPYGLWLVLESLFLVAVPIWLVFLLLTKFFSSGFR